MAADHLDHVVAQWRRERPDLDVSPMGVVGRISRAARRLERAVAVGLARSDLREGSFDVLAALRRSGPPYRLSPGRLLAELMLSSGAMTNRLDRLEARRLVRRTPDPSDRRGVLVELTPAGQEAVDRAVELHVVNERRMLEALDEGEQETLARLLRKLLVALHDTEPLPDGSER